MLRRHPVQAARPWRASLHGFDNAPFAGVEFDEHVAATAAVHPFEALVACHHALCHGRRGSAGEVGFETGQS